VETSLENIQPVVLLEVEGGSSGVLGPGGRGAPGQIEWVPVRQGGGDGNSLARIMMCYLSGMQTSLVGGGVGQPNITAMLATLVKHIIIKAGEATEKVLCKRETRRGELVAILNQWVWLMEGEEYSIDCFKFLYSKVIECASLMAKLEWCVGDICREKDNATRQVHHYK